MITINEQQSTPSRSASSGGTKLLMPMVIAALFVFAVIGFYLYQSNKQTQSTAPTQNIAENSAQTPTETLAPTSTSEYKDGTYSATGSYVSPGGEREVGVTITIADGKISETEFEGKAEDATSKRFQGEFADNYQPLVMGKNLDEVNLTKVSGSSLTPKGFMDALTKIKAEAKG